MNPLPLLIGAGIGLLGFFQLRKSIKLAKSGIKMEAEVVAVNARESTDVDDDGTTSTSISYYPIFKFDYNQKPYRVESNVGFGSSRKYAVGKNIKIVFLPNEPEKASVQNFGNNWFMPVVLIVVGGIIAVFAFSNPS
jgi:hypothetical protein